MKEICLELIKAGKERFKYPIITVYLIVLTLWNWDVLSIYFLSNARIEDKINYINENYYDHWGRILWPLLKSIILIILIPALMLGLEYILELINKNRRKLKVKSTEEIRKQKLLTAEHEYQMEENRTGKKTILDWEAKVEEFQAMYEMEKSSASELRKEMIQLNEERNKFMEIIKNDVNRNRENAKITLLNEASNMQQLYRHLTGNIPLIAGYSPRTVLLDVFNKDVSLRIDSKHINDSRQDSPEFKQFRQNEIIPFLIEEELLRKSKRGILIATKPGEMLYEYLKTV